MLGHRGGLALPGKTLHLDPISDSGPSLHVILSKASFFMSTAFIIPAFGSKYKSRDILLAATSRLIGHIRSTYRT